MFHFFNRMLFAALCFGLVFGPLAKAQETRVIVIKQDEQKVKTVKQFWIGVQANPVAGALKSQLGIESGLVVEFVTEEGPAAKAGIEKYDVLLKFGDTKLVKLDDLVQSIAKSKDKESNIDLLRGGEKKSVQVKPAVRPATDYDRAFQDLKAIFPDVKGLEGKVPLRFQFARPGIAVPGKAEYRLEVDGTKITIKKEGDKPAAIVVAKDGKATVVSEKNLDELPEKVRSVVESALKKKAYIGALPNGSVKWLEQLQTKDMPEEMRANLERWMKRVPAQLPMREPRFIDPKTIEKKLDDTLHKLDALREEVRGIKAIEELQRELKRLRNEVDELKSKKSE